MPWKPLMAPQATVMKRQGKMLCPLTPTLGARFCKPSQNSGIEGHLIKRHTMSETAMNSSVSPVWSMLSMSEPDQ